MCCRRKFLKWWPYTGKRMASKPFTKSTADIELPSLRRTRYSLLHSTVNIIWLIKFPTWLLSSIGSILICSRPCNRCNRCSSENRRKSRDGSGADAGEGAAVGPALYSKTTVSDTTRPPRATWSAAKPASWAGINVSNWLKYEWVQFCYTKYFMHGKIITFWQVSCGAFDWHWCCYRKCKNKVTCKIGP